MPGTVLQEEIRVVKRLKTWQSLPGVRDWHQASTWGHEQTQNRQQLPYLGLRPRFVLPLRWEILRITKSYNPRK